MSMSLFRVAMPNSVTKPMREAIGRPEPPPGFDQDRPRHHEQHGAVEERRQDLGAQEAVGVQRTGRSLREPGGRGFIAPSVQAFAFERVQGLGPSGISLPTGHFRSIAPRRGAVVSSHVGHLLDSGASEGLRRRRAPR